jgi:hypothetical protein
MPLTPTFHPHDQNAQNADFIPHVSTHIAQEAIPVSHLYGSYMARIWLDLAWLRRRKMLTPGRRSSVVWSVGGNRVGEIMIVPLEDALLLVYRARWPRYMRHRTYQTLQARYMSLSRQNTADLQGFVSRLKRRIGDTT